MTSVASPLARVEEAHRLLAQARTVDEVKGVRDQAAAAALYAREQGFSREIIEYAQDIKVRAERKAGELLADIERTPAAQRHISSTSRTKSSPYQETLAETKLSAQTAHRWQQMAAVPEPVFEEAIREVKADGKSVTTAAVMRAAEATAQRDVFAAVVANDPSAEERMARARLKSTFTRASRDVRRDLLALHPAAVYAVLDNDDLLHLRMLLSDLEQWVSQMRVADSKPVRAVK